MEPERQPENSGNPKGRLRILVVEDDPDIAATTAALLSLHGHAVQIAGDGPTAVKMAEAQPPEVVLLDIGLPGMDGYEVARRLRQQEKKRTLLIATSGCGKFAEERLSSYDAGIDLHLIKPVSPQELEYFLERFQAVAPRKSC